MLHVRKDETITRTSLIVDHQRFVHRTFVDRQLIYDGDGDTDFEDCTFEGCTWTFDDAAERTLTYLSTLANKTGKEGRRLVEGIFNSAMNRVVLELHDEGRISAEERIEIKTTLAS